MRIVSNHINRDQVLPVAWITADCDNISPLVISDREFDKKTILNADHRHMSVQHQRDTQSRVIVFDLKRVSWPNPAQILLNCGLVEYSSCGRSRGFRNSNVSIFEFSRVCAIVPYSLNLSSFSRIALRTPQKCWRVGRPIILLVLNNYNNYIKTYN